MIKVDPHPALLRSSYSGRKCAWRGGARCPFHLSDAYALRWIMTVGGDKRQFGLLDLQCQGVQTMR